jgi:hypothetical protein
MEATDAPVMDPMKYKTALCTYFQQGFCSRATSCMFAHGEEELRQRPEGIPSYNEVQKQQKPKGKGKGKGLAMGAAMGQPGQPLGVPTVASLSAEAGIGGGFIEPPPFCPPVDEKPLDLKKVKTQLCRHYMSIKGCMRGEMCGFAHGEEELRQPVKKNPGNAGGKGMMMPGAGKGKAAGYGAYPAVAVARPPAVSPYASYGAAKGGKAAGKGMPMQVVHTARHARLAQQLKIAGKHSIELRNAWFAHVGPGGIKDPSKHPEEELEAFLAGWPNEVARAEADIVSSAGPSLVPPNGATPALAASASGHPTLQNCLQQLTTTHPSLTPQVIVCMGEPKDAEDTLKSLQVPPHIAAGVAAHWGELLSLASGA